jgi:hypothetical protein
MILLDVDPNLVKPGWMFVLVALFLITSMVLLYLSMRKQFRKIRTPDDAAEQDTADQAQDSASDRRPGPPT